MLTLDRLDRVGPGLAGFPVMAKTTQQQALEAIRLDKPKLEALEPTGERLGLFDEGAFRVRFRNSLATLTAEQKRGVVPVSVAVDALYRLMARGGVRASAEAYRLRLAKIKVDIEGGLIGAGAAKAAGKIALKNSVKLLTAAWDQAQQVELETEIESTIRKEGLKTMLELIGNRSVGHKKTKVKNFYTRKGAPILTTPIVPRHDS